MVVEAVVMVVVEVVAVAVVAVVVVALWWCFEPKGVRRERREKENGGYIPLPVPLALSPLPVALMPPVSGLRASSLWCERRSAAAQPQVKSLGRDLVGWGRRGLSPAWALRVALRVVGDLRDVTRRPGLV